MTNIINLNKVRKTRTQIEKRTQADENAVKFGRSKAQKSLDVSLRSKARKTLDDKKRDP